MKSNRWFWTALLLSLSAAIQLCAQRTDADNKLFKEIKAKADKGEPSSQFQLGIQYSTGRIVNEDLAESIKWYRKAAEQGYADAQLQLGAAYAFGGKGVEVDYIESYKWLSLAAARGNSAAELTVKGYLVQRMTSEQLAEAQQKKAAFLGQKNDSTQETEKKKSSSKLQTNRDFAEKKTKAEKGDADAQYSLGFDYGDGEVVPQDNDEALKWFHKAAEQGLAVAQAFLGATYLSGERFGKRDTAEAVKWLRKAAEQGVTQIQIVLGLLYFKGEVVSKDYSEAYKWVNLAALQGDSNALKFRNGFESAMSPQQVAEGQRRAANFIQKKEPVANSDSSQVTDPSPKSSGTGFFITDDGFLITNEHVVKDSTQLRLVTSAGIISAKVVKVDSANDLALLKAEGSPGGGTALPVVTSRAMRLGSTVATVGFPNIGLQGFAPKLAKGEIASLSGAGDDARYFQISVPVQPGNSGGALVDERGNVVGVVSAKLSARAALVATGSLPENVNYAVKSSFLLGFLESLPVVSAKLKDPNTGERKFEEVVKSAEQASVLVLVY